MICLHGGSQSWLPLGISRNYQAVSWVTRWLWLASDKSKVHLARGRAINSWQNMLTSREKIHWCTQPGKILGLLLRGHKLDGKRAECWCLKKQCLWPPGHASWSSRSAVMPAVTWGLFLFLIYCGVWQHGFYSAVGTSDASTIVA